ncbi:MAG: hypothetical protein ACYC75_00515 [Minisyncoccota bacterium]
MDRTVQWEAGKLVAIRPPFALKEGEDFIFTIRVDGAVIDIIASKNVILNFLLIDDGEKVTQEGESTFHLLSMDLAKQSNGESGRLLTDGKPNVYRMRNTGDRLWNVTASFLARPDDKPHLNSYWLLAANLLAEDPRKQFSSR